MVRQLKAMNQGRVRGGAGVAACRHPPPSPRPPPDGGNPLLPRSNAAVLSQVPRRRPRHSGHPRVLDQTPTTGRCHNHLAPIQCFRLLLRNAAANMLLRAATAVFPLHPLLPCMTWRARACNHGIVRVGPLHCCFRAPCSSGALASGDAASPARLRTAVCTCALDARAAAGPPRDNTAGL